MKEKFMLHYNFPPFSVGEAGRIGSTGRREVGHGKLAWRAINPVLKQIEGFPYTLRVVSEIQNLMDHLQWQQCVVRHYHLWMQVFHFQNL